MNPTRILLVDDEVSFTRLFKKNLEMQGCYEVRTENHGPAAVATARHFHPDIIFLDVMMPGMDGGQIAEELKRNPVLKNVPVVFLTAAIRPTEVNNSGGRIAGLPMMAKPVDVDQVMHWIETLAPQRTPAVATEALAVRQAPAHALVH